MTVSIKNRVIPDIVNLLINHFNNGKRGQGRAFSIVSCGDNINSLGCEERETIHPIGALQDYFEESDGEKFEIHLVTDKGECAKLVGDIRKNMIHIVVDDIVIHSIRKAVRCKK